MTPAPAPISPPVGRRLINAAAGAGLPYRSDMDDDVTTEIMDSDRWDLDTGECDRVSSTILAQAA